MAIRRICLLFGLVILLELAGAIFKTELINEKIFCTSSPGFSNFVYFFNLFFWLPAITALGIPVVSLTCTFYLCATVETQQLY
jgi:hypothetical protein